jgi:XTP/dITP diphosphohydrolase
LNESKKLVLATGNPGKIQELEVLLAEIGISIVPQGNLNIPDIEETGLTFVENAILKARNASRLSNLPALADDSGLEVDFLNGAPGIYSARFSGAQANDKSNRDKLLSELASAAPEKRNARYQAVLVYLRHVNDPTPIICQGPWEGSIAVEERGDQGFGYDSIFYVPETNCHAAELDAQTKKELSHRGKATREFLSLLSRF